MNTHSFNTGFGKFILTFEENGKRNKIEGEAAVVEVSHEPIYDEVVSMYDPYTPINRFAVDNNIEMRLKLATPFTVTTEDIEQPQAAAKQPKRLATPPVVVGRNYGRSK